MTTTAADRRQLGLGWSRRGPRRFPFAVAAVGLAVGLLFGARLPKLALPRSAPATAERLSPDDERQVLTILADARVTREAARAYFDAQGGAAGHAAELDELVDGTIRARLAELRGGARTPAR